MGWQPHPVRDASQTASLQISRRLQLSQPRKLQSMWSIFVGACPASEKHVVHKRLIASRASSHKVQG
ncbi:hypothetical protein H663_002575 [Limnohabitans planktonicus II-D5]|uniref:Uncharacterized protein n=1 Tax=Limnohabitans planktonicus II-D5 TaxID=1293045 RepID=A0A2T7UI41_9BURK|nr:hypothetical protein H663_002575 [Limnohabitans planktonicus II-D5]